MNLARALADKAPKRKVSPFGVDYWEFERGGKKYLVIAAVGHLFNLAPQSKGWGYPVFDVEWKPSFEIRKKSEFSEKYFKTIEALKGASDDFIIACDYDNEGSLLGY